MTEDVARQLLYRIYDAVLRDLKAHRLAHAPGLAIRDGALDVSRAERMRNCIGGSDPSLWLDGGRYRAAAWRIAYHTVVYA